MSNGDIPPFFLLPLNPRAPNIVTSVHSQTTESDSVCVSTRSIMKGTKFERESQPLACRNILS